MITIRMKRYLDSTADYTCFRKNVLSDVIRYGGLEVAGSWIFLLAIMDNDEVRTMKEIQKIYGLILSRRKLIPVINILLKLDLAKATDEFDDEGFIISDMPFGEDVSEEE